MEHGSREKREVGRWRKYLLYLEEEVCEALPTLVVLGEGVDYQNFHNFSVN